MSDKIINLNTNSFDKAISSATTPVLVDFWAPWCGPCKSIAPILEQLADELGDTVRICKVDVDDNSEIAGRYNIRAIPTMLLFKGGEVVEQVVGLTNKSALREKIAAYA